MEDIKSIVANNMRTLRQHAGITQGELAEKLNYSDKAISKWERAESLPDVIILKQLADIYGVTVDWLLTENHDEETQLQMSERIIAKNHFIITLLAVSVVWLVATIAYVTLALIMKNHAKIWLAFVVAVPVSCIVLLVFNSIWGKIKLNFVIISIMIWSLLLSVCLIFSIKDIWILFVIGIPAQIIVLLWSRLKIIKFGTAMRNKK